MSRNDSNGVSPIVAAALFTVLVPLPMGVGIPFL